MNYVDNKDKSTIIIAILCKNFGISIDEFDDFLKKKENRYLLILLLKNYRCLNREKIKDMLNIISDKSVTYNLNKAEEKLYINKEFREKYFEIEEGLNKII